MLAIDRSRALIRTFANPFEVSYEDAKTTLQLELTDLHCSDGLRSKFKKDDLLNFYKCLPKHKCPNLQQKAAVCASLFGSTYICKQASSLTKLNKCTQQKWLKDENLTLIL
jgi:hypothetical protein